MGLAEFELSLQMPMNQTTMTLHWEKLSLSRRTMPVFLEVYEQVLNRFFAFSNHPMNEINSTEFV